MKSILSITLTWCPSLADYRRELNKKTPKKSSYGMKTVFFDTHFKMNRKNIKVKSREMVKMVKFLKEQLKKNFEV